MTRYLTHMTSTEIGAIDKQQGVVILPIGAVEQHGAHLPVLTDTLIATNTVDEALALLPDNVAAWALPPMSYGKSTEHLNFAGTISLSAETLIAVLHDIGASVARSGFRRLAFVNGHGGNVALLNMVARDIRVRTGLMVFCIHGGLQGEMPFDVSAQEWKYGLHGGELETSLILAIAPEMVKMAHAVKHYPDFPETDTNLFFVGSASVAWLADDWSASGIYGDATLATAEKGRRLVENSAENIAKLLTIISHFEVAQPDK